MQHGKTLLVAGMLLILTTCNAQAMLTSTDNGLGVYDNVTNITWTADANLLGTMEVANPNLISTIVNAVGVIQDTQNYFDNGGFGIRKLSVIDFGNNGLVDWWGAQAFVKYLNIIDYGGSKQWALPISDSVLFHDIGSPLGELFYNELGGAAGNPIPASSLFTNEQAYAYWTGTESTSSPDIAWYFATDNGNQYNFGKDGEIYAWAVSPGNVVAPAIIPEPGVIWLLGTGLLGLLGMKRFQVRQSGQSFLPTRH